MPPMALLLIRAIEEITGVSRTMMFPDGYSERLSSGGEDDDAVMQLFHSMRSGSLGWRSSVSRDLPR